MTRARRTVRTAVHDARAHAAMIVIHDDSSEDDEHKLPALFNRVRSPSKVRERLARRRARADEWMCF
jgi:hypothetical protein